MVRKKRLELLRLAALEPKSSASTNFATSALSQNDIIPFKIRLCKIFLIKICVSIVSICYDLI